MTKQKHKKDYFRELVAPNHLIRPFRNGHAFWNKSHYFHIIGDGHQPKSVGVYIPFIRIPSLKVGGLPSPTKRDFTPTFGVKIPIRPRRVAFGICLVALWGWQQSQGLLKNKDTGKVDVTPTSKTNPLWNWYLLEMLYSKIVSWISIKEKNNLMQSYLFTNQKVHEILVVE